MAGGSHASITQKIKELIEGSSAFIPKKGRLQKRKAGSLPWDHMAQIVQRDFKRKLPKLLIQKKVLPALDKLTRVFISLANTLMINKGWVLIEVLPTLRASIISLHPVDPSMSHKVWALSEAFAVFTALIASLSGVDPFTCNGVCILSEVFSALTVGMWKCNHVMSLGSSAIFHGYTQTPATHGEPA